MKTKALVLAALAFFIVAMGNASELAKMNIVQVEAEKALVNFNIPDATSLEITLSAANGDVVYYKKTKERYCEYKKVFDFSDLKDGKYCVCINYGNQSLNRTLNVDDGQIAVGPAQRLYEPYFKLKDKKLNVSFLNCICEPVYVNIYRNGEHVSGHNLGRGLTVQKCLDLSRLRSGEYEIVLTDKFKDHKFMAKL